MSGQSWPEAALSEVCSLVTDGTHHSPPNTAEGDFLYVTAKNIRRWGLDLSDITRVSSAVHDEIFARCPVEQGDVLYIKDGVTAGLAAINHLSEPFSMLSSVALLKPKRDLLEPRYLKHWLNSPTMFARMTGEMTGSAIRRLVLRQIRSAAIPLAPLPEQKRIADKLDTLLARVDTCRNHLARVPAILKRFRQSVLAAATSGSLTEDWRDSRNLESWSFTTLGKLALSIRNGLSPKPADMPPGTPMLRISAVRPFLLRQDDLRYLSPDVDASQFLLCTGDLLFTRYNGSLEFVGACARVGELSASTLTYPDKLIRVRIDSEKALSGWVEIACNSPDARTIIERTARTSAGQTGISGKDIKALSLPLPTLAEQTEIVRRVESLFALADQLEARYTAARIHIDRLTPALLAKAFRGELVPQVPGDTGANPARSEGRVEPLSRKARSEPNRR